jgi:hypothetical protein
MPTVKATDAAVDSKPLGSGAYLITESAKLVRLRGFMLICNPQSASFVLQRKLRQNGKKRTVRVKLGVRGEIAVAENLNEWISGERGRIVAAILTLARAWIAAGEPRPTITLASLEDWAAVVGGILGNAGLEGFLLTPEERKHFDDPWQAVEREFVSCWLAHAVRDWQQFRKVKSRMLFNLAERCELQIGGGLRGHEHGQLTQFGMKLAKLRDKTFTVRATDCLPTERIPEVKVKVIRVGPGGDAWWCLDADEQQFAGLHFSSFWSGPVWD